LKARRSRDDIPSSDHPWILGSLCLALTTILVGCASSTTVPKVTHTTPDAIGSAIARDPLQGEWREEWTCHGLVATLRHEARPALFDRWIDTIVAGRWGQGAPSARGGLCGGKPQMFVEIAKFGDGKVVFFDGPDLRADGVDATYRFTNKATIVLHDCCDNIAPDPLTCSFQIVGGRLNLEAHTGDPWTLAVFAGDFERVADAA